MNQKVESKYAVGFSFFEGIGPIRFRLLKKYFGSAEKAYKARKNELLETGLGEVLVERFCSFRQKFDLEKFISNFKKNGIFTIYEEDKNYPNLLLEIKSAPYILFCRGNIELFSKSLKLAVVGTRKPTNYGLIVTEKITRDLVNEGFVIVSGMAMGIDAVAHKTALDNSGSTIAVLGCGVDICYPAINRKIYDSICKRGIVISEFPPGKRTSRRVFPSRNRIVAGLSLGVLITEGSAKSGALITASYAAEFGRDVFVVPGPITSEMSSATTFLLKQGAKVVSSVEDVLDEYKIEKRKSETDKMMAKMTNLSPIEKIIIELAKKYGEVHIDTIVQESNFTTSEIFSLVSMLEIRGLLKKVGNDRYILDIV